jgi:hypothetical protein
VAFEDALFSASELRWVCKSVRKVFLSGSSLLDLSLCSASRTARMRSSLDPYEAEADIFAGELLVPLPMLKRHFKSGMTAADVARLFAVSEQAASIAITTHFTSLFK